MNIVFEGYPLTDALERHLRTQFDKLSRHAAEPMHARVSLSVSPVQRIAATLSINGTPLHAEAEAADLYAAADAIGPKLERQIRARAGKRRAQRRGFSHHNEAAFPG